MHLIKVDAIDSTNSFARELFRKNPLHDPVCIVARNQLQGRGQRGTQWNSKPGQNLTFSTLYPKPAVSPGNQFLISAAVATGIIHALESQNIPKLKLKWPNDIMSANYKIGGILIENIVSEASLAATIIGVGLNVNQVEFEDLPAASSLKLVTGQHYILEELLQEILVEIEDSLREVSDLMADSILAEYMARLFRKGIPSTFQLSDMSLFTGMIQGVNKTGKLQVKTEDDVLREFDLKEVRLCF